MKKVIRFIQDLIEMYIPSIALVILFVIFCFQVFMRYIIKQPQAWTTEVEQSCFLWLVCFGACYAQRLRSHVTFTLIYDKLSIKGKAITAMIGNILITFTCFITFTPSLKYILGLKAKNSVTTILKWPKTYVFFPYIIFLVLIGIYAIIEIYEEIKVLQGDEEYIAKFVRESKSEAELAIEESLAQEQLDLNNIKYE